MFFFKITEMEELVVVLKSFKNVRILCSSSSNNLEINNTLKTCSQLCEAVQWFLEVTANISMHTMKKVCMKTFTMGTKMPNSTAVCTIVAKK